jgi:retron-type reverse transcriptase
MDNGKINGVVFLDIKKAFDSINHRVLLNKMNEQFGIFGSELKWFESYLTNRVQQCSINGKLSDIKRINLEWLRVILYWGPCYFYYILMTCLIV